MNRVAAILAAGGTGKRLKSRRHKPFVRLAGRPMLAWTLSALEAAPGIDRIVIVAHRSDIGLTQRLVRSLKLRKVTDVVPGGATRMESVYRGMRALPVEVRWVLVHDAARPLVTRQLVEGTLKAARSTGAAIAAVPVVPTIKEAADGWVLQTLERRRLWAVQTPQVFRRDLLEKAHAKGRQNGATATDDSALVEKIGGRVRIVIGSDRNLKVTTPADLILAEALLGRNRK